MTNLIVADVNGENRLFDYELRCWVKPLPRPEPARGPRSEIVRPRSDGSGVWWSAIDRKTGALMWRIEMRKMQQAIEEKARLCLLAGGRPGWVYLQLGPQ